MHNTLRGMRDIEKQLSDAMQPTDLDPRLRSEIQNIRNATSAVMLSLSLLGMVVSDMLKEAAKHQSIDRKPFGETILEQGRTRSGSDPLAIVDAVLRRH